MKEEIFKINGTNCWLVNNKIVNEQVLTESEINNLKKNSKGNVEPILGNNKKDIEGIIFG